jgi:hypothetical protein
MVPLLAADLDKRTGLIGQPREASFLCFGYTRMEPPNLRRQK